MTDPIRISYAAAAQEFCVLGLPITEGRALNQHPHRAEVQQQLDRLREHVDFLFRFIRAVARAAFGQAMLLAHWAAMGNKGRVDEDSLLAEPRAQASRAVDDLIADTGCLSGKGPKARGGRGGAVKARRPKLKLETPDKPRFAQGKFRFDPSLVKGLDDLARKSPERGRTSVATMLLRSGLTDRRRATGTTCGAYLGQLDDQIEGLADGAERVAGRRPQGGRGSERKAEQVAVTDVEEHGLGEDVPADEALNVLTLQRSFDDRAFKNDVVGENQSHRVLVAHHVRGRGRVDLGDPHRIPDLLT